MKIIKIGAIWCPSCLIVNNYLTKLKNNYDLDIIEYDYDFDDEYVKKYNVKDILPEVIFVNKQDQEIGRIIGEKSLKEYEEKIQELEKLL